MLMRKIIFMCVIMLMALNGYAQKNFTGFIFVPLIAALLICFDAPGFYTHTRYGFPILCTVPFLYGFLLTKREER